MNTYIVAIYQVGRTNKNGTLVARESRAIEDIMKSLDINQLGNVFLKFISYNGGFDVTYKEEYIMKEFAEWINNKFKCELPKDYYEFIEKDDFLEYKNKTYNFMENGKKTSSDMHYFYKYAGPDNLKENYSLFFKNGIIKKNYLPIGEDSFGNVICLYLGKRANGSVYFVVHDTPEHECIKINNCFGEFLSQLQGEKDLYEKNNLVRKKAVVKKSEFFENVLVSEIDEYRAFLQKNSLKYSESFMEYMKEQAGNSIETYISFKSKQTNFAIYVKAIMTYKESIEEYMKNTESKKIGKSYLPFGVTISKFGKFLYKCNGKNAGMIYYYDGIMRVLYPAFDSIHDFVENLMKNVILITSSKGIEDKLYEQWKEQAENVIKGSGNISLDINNKKLLFSILQENDEKYNDMLLKGISMENPCFYCIYCLEKKDILDFIKRSFWDEKTYYIDDSGEILLLR